MDEPKENIALLKSTNEALEKFEKINTKGDFDEIIDKLKYVHGSYNHDGNPVGVVEFGKKALELLKDYKQQKPRQVGKKLIDNLEKSLAEF
ncbi:hypothetical protein [Aureibacter tunicatorum]|uniref:Uncharacterized protein n=1 Tax=Aureibacter tunicatorum TaxID=866807 RepID=A0AAE4BS52_9BACT|nr:hypothetical protein [Aureibacter tunicatorum]MDR6239396.1 hypothetical protein [Aureibacter tunicatorum]BDD04681.1 hypothetical protein AUTU_21640 [Aureibacter tunicatorum]